MGQFMNWVNAELLDHYFFRLIAILLIVIVAFVIGRFVRAVIHQYFTHSSISSKIDPTRYAFAKNAASLVIFVLAVIAVFYVIPSLRTLGLSLFAGAGIFAAILGFAAQAAFANIVSGIFIVIFKPFRVDDVIKVGDAHNGVVEDITLRHTVIRNFENRRIVIPNSIISNDVIVNSSLTDERICVHLELGIGYGSNIDLAMQIMQEEAETHPLCIDNRDEIALKSGEPKVKTRVIAWADSAVTLRAWVWAANQSDSFELKCALLKSIKERFDREGVEIPFPHRTLVYKQPQPLSHETSQAQ